MAGTYWQHREAGRRSQGPVRIEVDVDAWREAKDVARRVGIGLGEYVGPVVRDHLATRLDGEITPLSRTKRRQTARERIYLRIDVSLSEWEGLVARAEARRTTLLRYLGALVEDAVWGSAAGTGGRPLVSDSYHRTRGDHPLRRPSARSTGVSVTLRWADLDPDTGMGAALDHADVETSRTAIEAEAARIAELGLPREQRKREREPLRDMRKRWSERFANGSATMLANELRSHRVVSRRFRVAPLPDGTGQETFWPLGYRSGKRIDVVVAGELAGLQLGASLKGLNFRDDEGGNFDKNLTGRLYELADEMTTVHRHLPRAFMAGIFFLPVDACFDKGPGQSSFAHTVLELRRRSGRDPADPSQLARCDFAAVGLYAPGGGVSTERGIDRGVVRFFSVDRPPARRGLPVVETTLTLAELADRLLSGAIAGTAASDAYGDAEDEVTEAEESTALEDVVLAEESGDIDEIALEE